jgi:carbamoyl-phosphate synthase large subunit
MRERIRELGYESPDYELCYSLEAAEGFLNRHGVAVIKPPDSQSSRGVHIVRKGQDIDSVFQDALSAGRCGNVLIEEFLDGVELTVEGYRTRFGHRTLAISEKRKMDAHPQIAQTVWYSVSSLDKHARLVDMHDSLIDSIGLPFGITHTEYKYHNGKYSLIEAAARGGGTKISSDIVPCFSGVDVYQMLLADVLGVGSGRLDVSLPVCSVVLDFFSFEPGVIKSITGVDSVLEHPNVIDIALNFRVGDSVPLLVDDRSRAGYIIAFGQNDAELSKLLPSLKEKVRVTYE